jgi:hypothetical protein
MLGLSLLIAPQEMKVLWPWQAGKLMLQLYSVPLLTYGIGSFFFTRQRTWSEVRLGLLSMAVFTGAELAATIFHFPLFDGHPLSIVVWIVWLAGTTGMLAFLAWKAFGSETAPAHNPLLTQS